MRIINRRAVETSPVFRQLIALAVVIVALAASTQQGHANPAPQSDTLQYRIIVTTAGYTSIYRYDGHDFARRIKQDLKLFSDINIENMGRADHDDRRLIRIDIGRDTFSFEVWPQMPIIRLQYDRNRRRFTAEGLNTIGQTARRITYPSFKGKQFEELWSLWREPIKRAIDDKNIFEQGRQSKLILELDIDADGFVHKITELGGAIKSYSQSCITTIFDIASRNWTPATIDGQAVESRTIICLGDQSSSD